MQHFVHFWANPFPLKSVRGRPPRPWKTLRIFPLTTWLSCAVLCIFRPTSSSLCGALCAPRTNSSNPLWTVKNHGKIATFSRNFVTFSHRKTSLIFPFQNSSEIPLDCQTPRHTAVIYIPSCSPLCTLDELCEFPLHCQKPRKNRHIFP